MNCASVILIVCNRVPYPLKDGGALAMYAMIKGWHEAGKQVHVLAMNTSRHPVAEEQLPELFHHIAGFEMVPVDTGIRPLPVLRNLLLSRKPQHTERFYHKDFEKRLLATIKKIQPGSIQLESIYLHEYTTLIRQHCKAPIIQRLHNIEAEVWQRLATGATQVWKRFYLDSLARRIKRYEQKAWAECDGLVAISHKDLLAIRETGCSTPAISIPYGITLTGDDIPGHAGQWAAYHIGAMDWKPNIEAMDWMKEAIVPEICRLVPDFSFQFAGRNMPGRFLAEKNPSFFCAGEVADAGHFIANSNILIVPLRSGSGIRVKTLEAMAAGKLVISTAIGMQGIDAIDKVHFLQADTPEAFASAVEWVVRNKEKAQKITHNAFELLKANHNQPELIKRLAEFVEKLS